DRKVSKGCESTGFEETCRSGERRGQETLAEHSSRPASKWLTRTLQTLHRHHLPLRATST
ncbi:MAG: hypothetical protein COY42_15865, partial [Armatimonadetes bacterium CG_4_10_14_0_8_um_filter_66_14]